MNDANNTVKPSLIPNNATTSIVGSVGLTLAALIAGWLSAHNIIPAADVTTDTAVIGTIIVGVIGAGIVWFKGAMATKAAQIQAVNTADNGVKVVAATVLAPVVTAPIVKDK